MRWCVFKSYYFTTAFTWYWNVFTHFIIIIPKHNNVLPQPDNRLPRLPVNGYCTMACIRPTIVRTLSLPFLSLNILWKKNRKINFLYAHERADEKKMFTFKAAFNALFLIFRSAQSLFVRYLARLTVGRVDARSADHGALTIDRIHFNTKVICGKIKHSTKNLISIFIQYIYFSL